MTMRSSGSRCIKKSKAAAIQSLAGAGDQDFENNLSLNVEELQSYNIFRMPSKRIAARDGK